MFLDKETELKFRKEHEIIVRDLKDLDKYIDENIAVQVTFSPSNTTHTFMLNIPIDIKLLSHMEYIHLGELETVELIYQLLSTQYNDHDILLKEISIIYLGLGDKVHGYHF